FEPIKPVSLCEEVLTLDVPSAFFCEWLEKNYINIIRSTIRHYIGEGARLQYRVHMDNSVSNDPITTTIPSSGSQNTKNRPTYMPMNLNRDGDKSVPNPLIIPGIQKIRIQSQLKESYNLENFMEGECNRLARAAGFAVAQNPGKTAFNPLLIYGGVGLGKTHLANAIGIKVKENYPDKNVLYVTSEQFMQQYAEAGREGATNDFINFYDMIDVLIIDDIQFWSNKAPKTQEAFFHIFNYLHQHNNQIIITSDKMTGELQGLEPRLLSRMKWGLAAELTVPDVETRKAILAQKLKSSGITMPDDVIDYVAYSVDSNVRELEGALISLMAQASLNNKEVNLDLARHMIDKYVKGSKREITIDYILKVTSDYFGQPIEAVQSATRKRDIVQVRQVVMYLSKKYTKHSLSAIGAQCGNKDHATVLHAFNIVKNQIEKDRQFRYKIEELEQKFQQ
ncbi:MAG: chromosomal replication initiator protein DnaA, partial [Bacteroidales bacterium]|nr:chromosomal replication initiator protein DnaA [Bacteroidales bacterium]